MDERFGKNKNIDFHELTEKLNRIMEKLDAKN